MGGGRGVGLATALVVLVSASSPAAAASEAAGGSLSGQVGGSQSGQAGGNVSGQAGGSLPGQVDSAAPRQHDVEPTGPFGWPLTPPPAIGRPFQPPTRPYGPGHRGADLVGSPGQPVLAAGDGTVVYAAPLADRGVVSVDHADGLRTTYEPVLAAVRPGQPVRRGETVGALESGHRGCPGAACLHWGLRRGRAYLDPLLLVRRARVRLLPWPADLATGPAG